MVVGTDGGLVPVAKPWPTGDMAERNAMRSLSTSRNTRRAADRTRNLPNKNNVDYDFTNKIMAFDVTDEPVDTTDPTWNRIPTTLASSEAMFLQPAQSVKTRKFRLKRNDSTNLWTINDDSWQDVIASGYKKVIADPELNSVEIWEIENKSGGWFHPLHIHLVDFQILSRNGQPAMAHERGPKDVVYVGEGETVRLL